jgi:hypothetical protein
MPAFEERKAAVFRGFSFASKLMQMLPVIRAFALNTDRDAALYKPPIS